MRWGGRVRAGLAIGFASVALLLAFGQSQLHAVVAALAIGMLIGIFGHVVRSRPLVLAGILVVGGVSVWFSFIAQPR